MMHARAIANIDLSALRHNYQLVQAIAPNASILVMVKGNAYGHGMIRVANSLPDADAFGVASLAEAIILRKHGIQKPLLVMSGFQDKEELVFFYQLNLSAMIHTEDQIALLENNLLPRPIAVWLKIDTGMGRLGFHCKDTNMIYQRLKACNNIQSPIVLITHLADADNSEKCFTKMQIDRFSYATKALNLPKSIVNSAGLLAHNEAVLDWIRPGIILYGASPLNHRIASDDHFRPVMTLTAPLIAYKHLAKGDSVGYSSTWRATEDMPIGIVGIGYGDGYPRHAKNGTLTLLNNQFCPLVGRVSMDMLAIDLRPSPNAKIGDTVTLWGKGLPVEHIAQQYAKTIPHELLCGITQRVHVIYE